MSNLSRLYESFQPEHYDVYLDVDRQSKTIKGITTITGDAKQANIAVNQKDLQVESVTSDSKSIDFTVDNDQEVIKIDLPKDGQVTFTITYHAALTDPMMGIYPSYYEVNGEKKELVGTQFESTFARQAFPCVDEPEAKATFSLAIKFDEQPGETIISNMPEKKEENGVHYFDETVKMSTYLVAFAFGEMQNKMTETKSGVKVGVFGTKAHAAKELDFALDIAKRSIEFFEDFYQTPYPLPHSWQLGLPDFSAGAMENWGLVTYREAYLLLDPDNNSLETKERVASVIAHELAHQWFGDLVTMRWWDDLWLNESFANMMEYVAVDALKPEWHIWDTFQTTEAPMALQRDAIDGVQSVHVAVNDPAEIDALFDAAIVYAKGARMLVMVRALIGDDALRKGLKSYFAAHKYGNATGGDLWAALGQASGIDLGNIMNSWLEQPGYPVVNAKVENGELKLSQTQFFIGGGVDKGRQWQIPLNSNYDAAPRIFKDHEVTLGNYEELRQKAGKPFRVNVGNNSHFIVKYDQTLLDDILIHVDELDAVSKMQILQDLRLLAQGRQVSYASVIPLLPKFADSESFVVNNALYRLASSLTQFVTPHSEDEKHLKAFFNRISAKQFDRLGWLQKDGDNNDDELTRPYVLNAALYGENDKAIEEAHALFEKHADHPIELPADVRALILSNEIRKYGSADKFNQFLEDYRHTSDPSYKEDLTSALVRTKDQKQIAEIVSNFENSDTIKPQDLRGWYRGVLANDDGQQAAWDWIRKDWQWLEDTVGGDMEFATFITVTSYVFHTPQRLEEFKAFFEPKLDQAGLSREIKMDIKSITGRVNLVEDEKQAVRDALK